MADPAAVELRAMCPREIVDALDAVSMHRKISRTELLVQVLAAWRDDRIHEASVLMAVAGRNPVASDAGRNDWPEVPRR